MSDSVASKVKTETLGLLGHLIEMRDRLLRAVILIGIAFVCLFPFAKNIYNWLAAPLVNQGQEMLIIGPVAPFLIPMKLTLMVAFLITLPYLFYQLWSFVAPGLYKHEKRLIYPLIASSIFLFYLGIAFVYYILLPMMFKIIPQFAPEVAVFSPDIAMYLDFTIMMFIAFGFGFEMPIATILLISTGITTAEELKKKRPYVIVGAFIVGMLLTPPDVISQIMLAIPMWLLFELGLIFSKFFKVRIEEASDARKDMDGKNTANAATASAAAANNTPVLDADTLWEDEDYIYEDESEDDFEGHTSHNEYQDSDSFDMGTPEDKPKTSSDDSLTDGSSKTDTDNFYDKEGFTELSDEEMDAELDKIEEDEVAEDALAKKKAPAKSTKKAATKKATTKKTATKPKTAAKKTTSKKASTKKPVAKKPVDKKPTTKKVAKKKPAAKKTPPKKKS